MNIRSFLQRLAMAFLVAATASCHKATPAAPEVSIVPATLSPDTALRIHWLGKKRLGVAAGAYYVMRLWQLPESKKLESQTLDKLSFAPWRLLRGDAAASKAPAAFLRPLLEDVVQDECYFEIRYATNQPEEIVFAIRLDDARAGLWRTNLVAVIASLSGIQTMDILDGGQGWLLKQNAEPNRFELTRAGEWTILGIGQDSNNLMKEVVGRIRKPESIIPPHSEPWLKADLDLNRLGGRFAQKTTGQGTLPKVSISLNGDGGNILTHAEITFPAPLQIPLAPWSVPTNLIHEPLAGFMAIRGLAPMLKTWKLWSDLQIGAPPDQAFFWSVQGNPFQTYLAAPLANARDKVADLTKQILNRGNPWLASHGYISFEKSPDSNGVTWGNLPNVRPFFKFAETGGGGVLFAGLFPDSDTTNSRPLRPELLQKIFSRTNLIAYNWENTAQRIEASISLGQFARLILRRPELPLDSVSAKWLKIVMPRVGDSKTIITQTGTNQISFDRESTLGFTGAELNLLAEWLESPGFPRAHFPGKN